MGKICPLLAVVVVVGCVEPEEPEPAALAGPPYASIDPRRSLAVTDLPILERFSFRRVMDQLVGQSGVTSRALFQQWWDTQNPSPGVHPGGPHCDVNLNGFPYTCRPAPAEGAQATLDPFVGPGEYLPIGLFNRFDLAPADGSTCGEHRIVYAKRSGLTNPRARNLVIFEMALTNPHPQQGLKGCRKLVEWWARLTDEPDVLVRAARLEQLYFTGIPSFPPVVHADHLGGGPSGAGQVRTNQFVQDGVDPRLWSLREFKLIGMKLVPVPVKNNPFGGLFRADSQHPLTAAFRDAFVDQVPALAAHSLDDLDFQIDVAFDTAQAQASGGENDYVAQLGTGPNPLRDAIVAKLAELGSPLIPEEIVARAQSLSCAGCHRLSNRLALGAGLVFPSSLGFVHVSERDTEVINGITRFQLSEALVGFLVRRKQVMEAYLNENLPLPQDPKDPIGGRRTH